MVYAGPRTTAWVGQETRVRADHRLAGAVGTVCGARARPWGGPYGRLPRDAGQKCHTFCKRFPVGLAGTGVAQVFSGWQSAASQDLHAPYRRAVGASARTSHPGGFCSTLASQGKERDVGRLTPHEYQRMAELGQALSQSRAIALAAIPQALIRVDAWQDRIEHRQAYRRSQQPLRPYRWDIPEATLRQITLYQVLEAWEKRQERQRQVTQKDFLIRYIKCLVLHTMMRDASHVAMALGCRLYRYHPGHIESLAPDLIAMPWRLRREIDQVITARFPALDLNRTREPTPAEQRLVHDLLSRLAPWAPSHPNTPTPLAVLFAQPISPQRGAQIHVLIDTQGACGLAQLISSTVLFPFLT